MIDELRQIYPLKQLLTYLGVAKATFYYHLKQFKQKDKHQDIKDAIKKIYHTHQGRYGYRRITLALKQLGFVINHKKVWRLMNQMGLKARIRSKRRFSAYQGKVGKIADNVLKRDLKQIDLTKNGRLMSLSLKCWINKVMSKSFTCLPSWICLMEKLLAIRCTVAQIMAWLPRCLIRH